ncbi:hypothetical protein Ddye_020901 [Dipteronia dyeriana]|uniref:Uncharacterized protein n=1 Tax=Dipteronia dyeriana TaxID=168575 RepID=A0AAD9WWG0_9ROSI|nr:hypothetical protein Ddye_020901 [Dipteronia dyeriana]
MLYSQQSVAKIAQLIRQLVSDFVLKIKNIEDALMAVGEDVKDNDLVLTLINGFGHEFDAIVVVISTQQRFISFENTHFLLMMHEQCLEHLDSPQPESGQILANYASNNVQDRKGQRDGNTYNNRGGGNRGRDLTKPFKDHLNNNFILKPSTINNKVAIVDNNFLLAHPLKGT